MGGGHASLAGWYMHVKSDQLPCPTCLACVGQGPPPGAVNPTERPNLNISPTNKWSSQQSGQMYQPFATWSAVVAATSSPGEPGCSCWAVDASCLSANIVLSFCEPPRWLATRPTEVDCELRGTQEATK